MPPAVIGGFEAWRLVLVARLIVNCIGIGLNLLSCRLLRKLGKKRRHHTSITTLLYLSYAELSFAITSQAFSVLFLASHTSDEDHKKSSPMQHNKLMVLIALAGCGSLKHSSLFVRQWWVASLCALHIVTKLFRGTAARVARRAFVHNLFTIFVALGVVFGAVRLVAEKIPEYFHKTYISHEYHEVIHRALHVIEFGLPPLLVIPGSAALAMLLCRRTRVPRPPAKADSGGAELPRGEVALNWSRKSSQAVLAIALLFLVCQGPLILLDGVGADSRLFINLQDLITSFFSCTLFAVLACCSAAFRRKLVVACTCTVTPSTVAQDTVLDSCCEMVANDSV